MAYESSSSELLLTDSLDIDKEFHLGEELPSSGFNRLVIAKRWGRRYMLKGLKERYLKDKIYRELLRKEFDILMTLNHPSVVRAEGLEEVSGLGTVIVMEYIDGVTLAEFLTENPARAKRRKVADQLIEALGYIHQMQVVHRDLKPQNILITRNGNNLKLIDFGLGDTDSHTILKQPAGTRSYISGEQASGSGPDCRNDLYSLGKILMELRAGWAYRAVAQRCLRPIDKRPASIELLRRSIDRRRLWLRISLWSIMALLCIYSASSALWNQYTTSAALSHDEMIEELIAKGSKRAEEIYAPNLEKMKNRSDETHEEIMARLKLWETTGEEVRVMLDSLTAGLNHTDKSVITNCVHVYISDEIFLKIL